MLWGLQPVDAPAAYSIAVSQIARQIHLGLLLPEERLPAERKLASEINVSRVTLREAFRVLEERGYIEIRRGAQGGAFVVGFERLRELAARRRARDPAAIMRVLEFRDAVQPVAARLAAGRRGVPHLKRLRAAVEQMAGATSAAPQRQAETLFQLEIGAASQNPQLAAATEDALSEMFAPLSAAFTETSRDDDHSLHLNILSAIDDRSADHAEAAMRVVIARDWADLRASQRAA